LIRTYYAREDGQEGRCEPPSYWITEEIDLLPCVVVRPETDSSEEEWPLEWLTGIGMTARESIVVEKHGSLEFEPFL
jgi:hypothetical protein